MNISETSDNGVVVVTLKGRLDAYYAREVEARFDALFREGKRHLVITLNDLECMSREGLQVLLAALREVRPEGGDIRLASMKSFVREVLDIEGFGRLFKSFETEQEAVDSYGS